MRAEESRIKSGTVQIQQQWVEEVTTVSQLTAKEG